MVVVVNRGEVERNLGPPAHAVHAVEGRHDHAHDVGRDVQRFTHHAAGALAVTQHAPRRFLAVMIGRSLASAACEPPGLCVEGNVDFVHAVLERLQVVARHVFDGQLSIYPSPCDSG